MNDVGVQMRAGFLGLLKKLGVNGKRSLDKPCGQVQE